MPDRRRLQLALLLWLLITALPAVAAPRIGVVTMEPGPEYWARFGHNAILVDDGRDRTLYNFGYFDFDQPGFLARFLQGDMRYRLSALPLDWDLRQYAADGRGVTLQWLALTPGEAAQLAADLAQQALPENAEYRYDYFTQNCSTKVRDALDTALGGVLQRQLSGRSQGRTFRSESLRLAVHVPWMLIGMHAGLSAYADRPLSLWEEAFVPMRLRHSLRSVQRADGTALVEAEQVLLEHTGVAVATQPPDLRLPFLGAGLILAVGLGWLGGGRHRPSLRRHVFGIASLLFWLLTGVSGVLLLLLWLATAHVSAWANQNLLLFNPLGLLLLPAAWSLMRGRKPGRVSQGLSLLLAALALLAVFISWLPAFRQDTLDWLLLLVPVHVVLACRATRA
jgi:uncharacterized membrane protein